MSWNKLRKYYVYTYLDNDKPYYIGMGSNSRVIDHHIYVTVPDWDKIEVIDNLSQDEASDLEIAMISKYGRKCNGSGILENLAPGGKTQKSGWFHSEDTKRRISESNKGKIRTAQMRENYKGPKTKEHAENIRQSRLGTKIPLDVKDKIGKACKISTTRYWQKVKSGEIIRKRRGVV